MENEIEMIRKELNNLIERGADFEEIKKVSIRLDECIVKYYQDSINNY